MSKIRFLLFTVFPFNFELNRVVSKFPSWTATVFPKNNRFLTYRQWCQLFLSVGVLLLSLPPKVPQQFFLCPYSVDKVLLISLIAFFNNLSVATGIFIGYGILRLKFRCFNLYHFMLNLKKFKESF